MKKKVPKRFKQGVAPVKGKPGLWDINYQVNGERETPRKLFKICDAHGNYNAEASLLSIMRLGQVGSIIILSR